MRKIKYLFLAIIAISFYPYCKEASSTQPFYEEIEEFKKADKKQKPENNAILFVGSSSIKMWDNLESDFAGFKVINRGFGGSGLDDAIRYANDIIIPYHPRQIVIYSGENDIASGKVTSTDVLKKFTTLFNNIRAELPNVHIVYVSMKPSPSREKFMPVIADANIMIRQFLSGYPETAYVDIYHPMLGEDGKPRPELFIEDMLHMNRSGYALWTEAIRPYLLK